MSKNSQTVRLNELEATAATILELLLDNDDVVIVKYVVGKSLMFMPIVKFIGKPHIFDNLEKSIATIENRFTRFDDLRFSQRSQNFQQLIINRFVQKYLSSPISDEPVSGSAVSMMCEKIVHSLFESKVNLEAFVQGPDAYISTRESEVNDYILDSERAAFIKLASEERLLNLEFDHASLGDAGGDGNTYILIGIEPEANIPSRDAMLWLHENLLSFYDKYAFMPSYGSYVTEAYLRDNVVLGPGVTEREKEFLISNGIKVYDRRNSALIGSLT